MDLPPEAQLLVARSVFQRQLYTAVYPILTGDYQREDLGDLWKAMMLMAAALGVITSTEFFEALTAHDNERFEEIVAQFDPEA